MQPSLGWVNHLTREGQTVVLSKKRLALAAVLGGISFGWCLESPADSVSYTVDSHLSSAKMSVLLFPLDDPLFQIHSVPQAANSDFTNLSGTLVADLSANSLTFSGTSTFIGQANPTGPFLPGGVGPTIENAGLTNDPNDAVPHTFDAALRNAVFTISAGSAAFNGPVDSLYIRFIAGRIDYRTSFFFAPEGTVDLLNDLVADLNQSNGFLTRTTSGGIETVTLPFAYSSFFPVIFSDDGLLTITGQIVASRTISTPLVFGDFNRDGQRTSADIQAMLSALADLTAYKTAKGLSDTDLRAIGDINGDYNPALQAGGVNNRDIQALLDLIAADQQLHAVPEPGSLVLFTLAIATAIGAHRRLFSSGRPVIR